jgi:hypothetical protein
VKEIDEEAAKEEDPRYAHNLKQVWAKLIVLTA